MYILGVQLKDVVMEKDSSMIAYCGINCSKCEARLATKSNDPEQIAAVAQKWSKLYNADIKPYHVVCDGCRTDERKSHHCQNLCEIRKCCQKGNHDHCLQCAKFSCEEVEFVLANTPDAIENLRSLKKDKN
jgi:hypothetical protein